MSKEAIIKKILDDASEKAEALLSDSREKAEAITRAATEECEQFLSATREELARQSRESLERAETVAELDSRRLLLDARIEMIDRVFKRALEKLTELDDDAMREILTDMLGAAEDGDEVLLNERGKEIVKAKDVAEYAKGRGIKLKLSGETGNFAGGMILRHGGVDKNLTFEVELELLRDSKEAEIAKQIFG